MDLKDLHAKAAWFTREISKHFEDDERLVRNFITKKQVVVISSKKLYVFYIRTNIDYIEDKLINTSCKYIDDITIEIDILHKKFIAVFQTQSDIQQFNMYYEKYRK